MHCINDVSQFRQIKGFYQVLIKTCGVGYAPVFWLTPPCDRDNGALICTWHNTYPAAGFVPVEFGHSNIEQNQLGIETWDLRQSGLTVVYLANGMPHSLQ